MDNLDPKGHQDPNLDPDNTGENDTDVEISEEEIEHLDEETSKKIKTLMAQKAHWRKKAKEALEKKEEPQKPNVEPKLTEPEPALQPAPESEPKVQDPEKVAKDAAVYLKKSEYLSSVPEDKRATVDEFFKSITAGKDITPDNFNNYMEASCRAAGVEPGKNTYHSINSSASGAVPPTEAPGPTKEQQEAARKAGNDVDEVYGEKTDFSNMLNAEKFVDTK